VTGCETRCRPVRSCAGATDAVADHDPRWKAAELRETLRERLGDDAYDRLWNVVAAMTIDQVVVQGLTEMQRVRASLAPSTT